MPRPLSDETKLAIRNGVAAGKTYATIGRELGLTPLAVKKALANTAAPPPRETEHFVADEPPAPRPAPKDLLEKRAAARRQRAQESAYEDPDPAYEDPDPAYEDPDPAYEDPDPACAVAVAALDDAILAADAGVDDEGFVEEQLELALDLLRGGAISLPEYIRATARLTQHSRRQTYDADPKSAYEPAGRMSKLPSGGARGRGAGPSHRLGGDRQAPRRKYPRDVGESAESRLRSGRTGGVLTDVATAATEAAAPAAAAPATVVPGALDAIRGYIGR